MRSHSGIFGAALLLDSRFAKWQGFFRTALFAPVVTTVVAVAVIWRYLLHTRYGLINQALAGLGIDPVDWLGDPHWSMPAIILFAAWKNFGYNMIILLAALQAVPREMYEAARVDGAGALRRFTDLTFPMLTPTLVMVGILTLAGYFQLFAEPYVMTQGGPLRSTVSVLYFMYEEGFRWWNLGFASAVAFVLFLVIFAVSWVLLRFDRDPTGATS
jgi:multiple sugar transport system permease protein